MSDNATPGALKWQRIGDRSYELMKRPCSNCGNEHFEIWRWAGPAFARYHMPTHFEPDQFEDFIVPLDEQLTESHSEIMRDLREKLEEVNCQQGIQADGSYEFRLLEYARQRMVLLRKLERLEVLTEEDPAADANQQALRAAFELGYAASHFRFFHAYEDYLWEGVAVTEWRDAGLPRAREERLRQGARSRTAVLKAAELLYASDRSLIRNDVETARRIIRLNLPELQKGNGHHLGLDAITRHLRYARKAHRM